MLRLDIYSIFYDVTAYLVAIRSLIDELLYKFGFKRHLNVREDLPSDLTGHVAIVTGGTRGLGLSVVKSLLIKGCSVIVASSQNEQMFFSISSKIYEGVPEKDAKTGVRRGEISLYNLDLSSMSSVANFVKTLKTNNTSVNYLICNAGIMFAPRKITVDGFESHLAINYLGHSLLILELLPELKRTADKTKTKSRIVSVSSSTHRATGFKFDDIFGEANYSCSQAYAQSKLAQIMFSATLSKKIRESLCWNNIQTFSLHPGIILSDLYEHVNLIKFFPFLVPLIKLVTRDMIEGAETTLFAALSKELDENSGIYLEDCALKEPSRRALSETDQTHLWHLTLDLLSPWLSSDFKELNLNKKMA